MPSRGDAMTRLRLRVDAYLEKPGDEEFKAVANIRPLPDKDGNWKEGRQTLYNIPIPIGIRPRTRMDFKEIELNPGRYLVEAVLPSGEKLQDEVDLQEKPPVVELHLQGERTPHEWLSKQYLFGTVQKRQNYEAIKSKFEEHVRLGRQPNLQRSATRMAADVQERTEYQEMLVESGRGNGIPPGCFFLSPKEIEKFFINPRSTSAANLGSLRIANLIPSFLAPTDDFTKLYRIDNRLLEQIGLQPMLGGDFQDLNFKRYFLFIKEPRVKLQYTVIPCPWVLSTFPTEAVVEVVVQLHRNNPRQDIGYDEKFRIKVNVIDDTTGPMIGYLGKGRLDSAKSMLLIARERLKEKEINPFSAAAGAYILLSDRYSAESKYFCQWVENLMNWFPWMPDGAILYASLLLKSKRGKERLGSARDALLAASKRGLPFYSKGVGLLLDGLTIFKNMAKEKKEEDQNVLGALKIAQKMALRTDFQQPFTTIMME
jgi:hypothetical protein